MGTPCPFQFPRTLREEYRERIILKVMGLGLPIMNNPKQLTVSSLITLRERSPPQVTLTFSLGNPGKHGSGVGLRCPSKWAFEWFASQNLTFAGKHSGRESGMSAQEPGLWPQKISGLNPSSLLILHPFLPSFSCFISKKRSLGGLYEIHHIKLLALCQAHANKYSVDWRLWHRDPQVHLHFSLSLFIFESFSPETFLRL